MVGWVWLKVESARGGYKFSFLLQVDGSFMRGLSDLGMELC